MRKTINKAKKNILEQFINIFIPTLLKKIF